MRTVVGVAADLLREALSRRWFLALGIGITLFLAVMGLFLRMDVVDGALSATRLFGQVLSRDIQSVDVALRPVFRAAAYTIFYGGLGFGILACADFGPSLLSPGRIEHLLSLPVRRWELIAGTFLGVLLLSSLFALYGAGGLTLILSIKTGVWTARPIVAALLASVTFSSIYGGMLATAIFARSAALSAAVGGVLLIAGIVASYRETLSDLFEPGVGRTVFDVATLPLPRVSSVADASADFAASTPIDAAALYRLLFGLTVFALGALALGVWRFEQKDF